MKATKRFTVILAVMVALALCFVCLTAESCSDSQTVASGARAATSEKVRTNSAGDTAEQANIKKRIIEENQPGAIKYFYAISAYNNSYIYATVSGKVTSSGKRLLPSQATPGATNQGGAFSVNSGGSSFNTDEVMNEDGTYGTSIDYIYFWDPQGNYYQFYPSGGWQIVVSDHPITLPEGVASVQLQPTTTK